MPGKKDLEKLRRHKRRRQRIIRGTVQFFVWTGVAVIYYTGFSLFFDTPLEYMLKHSTDGLRDEYKTLTARYDSLTMVLDNLSERDRNVFRILFESDPYESEAEIRSRENASYEALVEHPTRQLKRDLRQRTEELERRLEELNHTYHDLQALIDSTGTASHNIPAIQPVINKQLTLLTASYGMRFHPFYKTLQSHQGVDYTIPEGRAYSPRPTARCATCWNATRPRAARWSSTTATATKPRTATCRKSTSARDSRCGAATSSPARATRVSRWPPTSTTKCATRPCGSTRSTTFSWNSHRANTGV